MVESGQTPTSIELIQLNVSVAMLVFAIAVGMQKWDSLGLVTLASFSAVMGFFGMRLSEPMLARVGLDITLTRFVSSLSSWASLGVNGYLVLCWVGFLTRGDATSGTTVSIIMGIGCQIFFQNLAAGIALVLFRPFRVGDLMMHAGELVQVRSVTAFFTHVDTFKNHRLTIPNAKLMEHATEITTANAVLCMRISVFIRQGRYPCSQVERALVKAAKKVDRCLPAALEMEGANLTEELTPCAVYGPVELTPKGMEWQLWPTTTSSAACQVRARDLCNACIHDALLEAGIAIYEEGPLAPDPNNLQRERIASSTSNRL